MNRESREHLKAALLLLAALALAGGTLLALHNESERDRQHCVTTGGEVADVHSWGRSGWVCLRPGHDAP